jgi:hypothetical protein
MAGSVDESATRSAFPAPGKPLATASTPATFATFSSSRPIWPAESALHPVSLSGSDFLCSGGFILPFLGFFGARKLL